MAESFFAFNNLLPCLFTTIARLVFRTECGPGRDAVVDSPRPSRFKEDTAFVGCRNGKITWIPRTVVMVIISAFLTLPFDKLCSHEAAIIFILPFCFIKVSVASTLTCLFCDGVSSSRNDKLVVAGFSLGFFTRGRRCPIWGGGGSVTDTR